MIELHVGKNRAGAEVRFVAKNGIADVIKVRHLNLVEENTILELARVTHDDAVAHDHVFADVAARANMAAFPDPSRALQKSSLFHDGARTDENAAANVRFA